MERMDSSFATSHFTLTATGSKPVSRVHSTIPDADGYPEATPSANG